MELGFFVWGRPAPQGSKRMVRGRFIEASKFLPAWRKAITKYASKAIIEQNWETTSSPCELEVVFFLERPSSIPASKRPMPIKPPDIDKLVRAIGDACTDAKVWDDDSQVVSLVASKHYADGHDIGAAVTIRIL